MQLLTGLWQSLSRLTGIEERSPGLPLRPGQGGLLDLVGLHTACWMSGTIPERRKRLFGCACCRLAWPWIDAPPFRQAVRMSERLADGLVSREDVQTTVTVALTEAGANGSASADLDVEIEAMRSRGMMAGMTAALVEGRCLLVLLDAAARGGMRAEIWSALYHDLFDGILTPVTLAPAWLEWDGGTVVRMAQAIYDERQFDDLPILADALEEAGCDHAGLLAHCRSAGPHYPGCWALDALLGKE